MGKVSWALTIVILVGACATNGDQQSAVSSTTIAMPEGPGDGPEAVSGASGRLVVLDSTGNVVTMDPDGSNRLALTGDAGQAVYAQPIWSPDGSQVAYTKLTATVFGIVFHPTDSLTPRFVSMSSPPFYTSWAPDGSHVGALHNGARGIDFEMVDVIRGTTTVIAQGSPLYYSWSPDGGQLATHIGEERFETITTIGERMDLGPTDAGYLAPQWTSRGIVHVIDGELVIDSPGDERKSLADVGEQTLFVANRQANRVAIQSITSGGGVTVALGAAPELMPNVVSVLDLDTGELELAHPDSAIGFWWSPDGDSLLILARTADRAAIVAKVWSPDGGIVGYATYRPSAAQFREIFPFFPQYAQSMTFWAPDSSAFAIAGQIEDETGIWVQTLATDKPVLVSDGGWVSWSP